MSFAAMPPVVIAAGCLLAPLWCDAQEFTWDKVREDQASFITFQVPGSTATTPDCINDSLTVAGSYVNASDPYGTTHGFVRDVQGTITTFDVPGSVSTGVWAINQAGTVTGQYRDANGQYHGFVRSARGAITSFDVPGTTNTDTLPTSINDEGAVTGFYGPPSGQQPRGFLRDAFGTIRLFDPPGSIQTSPRGINVAGIIVGSYTDANDVGHGFLRYPWGAIISFDPPGGRGTIPWAINAEGTVTGLSYDSNGHGRAFVRSLNGVFTSFDDPLNGGRITTGTDINAAGVVSGSYQDANQVFHGLVRSSNGVLTSFDVPGSSFTFAFGINDFGVIVGTYAGGVSQSGYLRVPSGKGDDFEPGTYAITDSHNFYVDGGFYLHGDPTVRLWVYVAGNPSQHWKFSAVSGGFSMWNQGTGQYASDIGGKLTQGGLMDVWAVTAVTGGYMVKNNRTGLFLTDPAVQDGAVTLTGSGSIWQMSPPQ